MGNCSWCSRGDQIKFIKVSTLNYSGVISSPYEYYQNFDPNGRNMILSKIFAEIVDDGTNNFKGISQEKGVKQVVGALVSIVDNKDNKENKENKQVMGARPSLLINNKINNNNGTKKEVRWAMDILITHIDKKQNKPI